MGLSAVPGEEEESGDETENRGKNNVTTNGAKGTVVILNEGLDVNVGWSIVATVWSIERLSTTT